MVNTPSRARVCCFGPEATFTHAAALRHFGSTATYLMARSVPLVFREVENGHADYGVVPVENSIEGSVGATLDSFTRSSCRIVGEVVLTIEQNLLGTASSLNSIRRVYSHPQALAQCRDWLARNLPYAEIIPSASTASAAEQTHAKLDAAAVGGRLLADRYGLRVLAESIQDRAVNLTRFLVLGRDNVTCSTGCDRTSLMVSLAHRPGSLHNCLGHLAREQVNLTHIESRPCPDTPFEYTFFLDMEGHIQDANLATALAAVRSDAHGVTVLGSYPRDETHAEQTRSRNIPG